MVIKRVTVTQESNTGRNQNFKDNYSGNTITCNIHGIATLTSNPYFTNNNNLG
jgi:hypothetical protein